MKLLPLVMRFAFELGSDLWREWRRDVARERAANQWAETPAPVRACPRCREVSYTPGQTTCAKCSAPL